MSWARGEIDGREVGYAIAATCDKPGCEIKIDRGLDFRCGGTDFDKGCGGYFCYHDLWMIVRGQRCAVCYDEEDD